MQSAILVTAVFLLLLLLGYCLLILSYLLLRLLITDCLIYCYCLLLLLLLLKYAHLIHLRYLTTPPCASRFCASGHKKTGAEDMVIFRQPGCLRETL